VVRHSEKHWTFSFFRNSGLLAPTRWQIATLWRTWVPVLDRAMEAVLLKALVVITGHPCSMRRKASWCQQNSKAWSLGFTCKCGSRLLALSSKWRVPGGSKACEFESSGAHNTAEALGFACIGAWAPRNHNSCCRHGGS
jgi:hypothetical protein